MFDETDPNNAGLFSLSAYGQGLVDVPIGWNPYMADEAPLGTYASVAGVAADGDYALMPYVRVAEMPGMPDI